MKKIFLFCTSDEGIFKILVESSKLHLSKKTKKYVEAKRIKKKFPSLDFYFFFIGLFLSGKIFNARKLVYLKYRDFSIGKHVLSETRRFYNSYNNSIIFFLIRCKILFSAGRVLNTAIHLKNHAEAIFVDHLVYVNGLYFEVFFKYKKIIYSNGYPKGFFVIDGKNNIRNKVHDTSMLFKAKTPKKISNKQKKLGLNKIKKNLIKPTNIKYMKNVKFTSLDQNIDFSNVSHVIYAHSFTDAQLVYGVDGFSDTLDWLDFTISKLSKLKTKIVIKGHPNFYNEKPDELTKIDNKIFQKIVAKYSSNENLIFLNSSIRNYELLKKLNKKTILITHHGTLIFDASIFKYKVITSSQTFYIDKVKLSNTWDTVDQYERLLSKKYSNLIKNYDKLYNISYGLYYDKYNTNGKNFYIKTIKKYIKLKGDSLDSVKIDNDLKKLKNFKRRNLFEELGKTIENVVIN